ncbi:hypothetical protein ACO0QE_000022 [Hanseniaspora vineae]
MTSIGDLETSLQLQNYENSKILKKEAEEIKLILPTNEQSIDELFLTLQVEKPNGLNFYEQREHLSKQIALYPAKRKQLETLLIEKKDLLNYETVSATEETDFYTPASDALVGFRLHLMAKQFKLKKEFLDSRKAYLATHTVAQQVQQRRSVLSKLDNYNLQISATGSTRPISAIKLQNKDVYFSTWNGEVKKYSITDDTMSLIYEHAGKISALDVHKNMIVSGSTDNNIKGLIWDVRSGSKLFQLQHTKAIHCSAWTWNDSPITGSADGSIQIWDLRKPNDPTFTIPAHTNIVTDLVLNADDQYLVSTSYDKTINVYSCGNWVKSSTLEGSLDKSLCLDVGNNQIVAGGWDRSVKVWA